MCVCSRLSCLVSPVFVSGLRILKIRRGAVVVVVVVVVGGGIMAVGVGGGRGIGDSQQ